MGLAKGRKRNYYEGEERVTSRPGGPFSGNARGVNLSAEGYRSDEKMAEWEGGGKSQFRGEGGY